MIIDALEKEFNKAIRRGWEYIYVLVDLHETTIYPNFSDDELPTEFYPLAKETLQLMTERDDLRLILWTCSHPDEIEKYIEVFEKNNIHFEYINENPEITTGEEDAKYGNYDKKMYTNLIFEDKAGFHPREWEVVKEFFDKTPLLTKLIRHGQ